MEEITRFWKDSKGSASSWFYFPKEIEPQLVEGIYCFEANNTYIAVVPLTHEHFVVNVDHRIAKKLSPKSGGRFFDRYGLIVFKGQVSGYVLESCEKNNYKSLRNFVSAIRKKNPSDRSGLNANYEVDFTNIGGDKLNMVYQPMGLRCVATINGEQQNWDKHTSGAVYEGPYVKIGNGVMEVTDGREGYRVDFTGNTPKWRKLKF